ncbi:MAG: fumarylacetoacetate hydrolase family protein [Thermomicrobia bacterium]|nr:fumarylacetoacetate hydrolase family protein [Thermomicrobia bacterium]
MRIVVYDAGKIGLWVNDQVIAIDEQIPDGANNTTQGRLARLLENLDGLRPALQQAMHKGPFIPVSEVILEAPVPKPSKIVCAFANYTEGGARSEVPLDMFLKSPASILGPGGTIVMPPFPARIFHHEAELAFVIGKGGAHIAEADAMQHVAAYTCFMDISARDSTRLGKSFDTFGPIGPALVTADEVPDPHNLNVKLYVNDDLRQDYNTSDMANTIPALIAFASSILTLEPGDVVATGTNHQGLSPIQDGDHLRLEIERVGTVEFDVRDDMKREWPRTIDEEMARRVRQM